ncbi:TetR family transcriptional regulator [Haematobacter missouriensis]|uniref:TetR family transcriptional regulator n=2 Tax=Haematobacter TaxID=366614 RepID=A0A212AJE4_9RHOB|nr:MULTISPECIES: CerR family C-terminal domain-containing protein [Haematobacter]OWJ76639.1 TetR family transcriptional regulator [Haematobacter genomosp. 1]OWJ81535.1 TetR family transcriptional regulator [Haematobacter missouriensis]
MRRPTAERGDATRERLLNAAIDVFGLNGFHGTTTRMLNEAAAVNQQAIPYYFGGKEGLYVAAAEHIGAVISGKLTAPRQMLHDRLSRMDEGGEVIGDAEARQMLTLGLQTFAGLMISDQSEPWARFIVREQMAPTEAFDRIYAAVMRPMLGIVCRLVAILLSEDPDSEHVRLRALSLAGGILVFRMARAAALRTLAWEAIGDREIDVMRAHVADLVASFGHGRRS